MDTLLSLLPMHWIFEALGAVSLAVIVVSGHYSFVPGLGVGVALHLAAHGARILKNIRETEARATARDQSIRVVLQRMHSELWQHDARVRSTILLPDNENQFLAPRIRYKYGQNPGPLNSNAKFGPGVGLAGFAWNNPQDNYADMTGLGPFESESAFLAGWEQRGIPPLFAKHLSRDMWEVQSIYCRGLVDRDGYFLGVLSIDARAPMFFPNEQLPRIMFYVQLVQALLPLRTPGEAK